MDVKKQGADGRWYTYKNGKWELTLSPSMSSEIKPTTIPSRLTVPPIPGPVAKTSPEVFNPKKTIGLKGSFEFLKEAEDYLRSKATPEELRFIQTLRHAPGERKGANADSSVGTGEIRFFRGKFNPLTGLHENNHLLTFDEPTYRQFTPDLKDNRNAMRRALLEQRREIENVGDSIQELVPELVKISKLTPEQASLDLAARGNRMLWSNYKFNNANPFDANAYRNGRKIPEIAMSASMVAEESGVDLKALQKAFPQWMEDKAPILSKEYLPRIKALLPAIAKVGGTAAGLGLLAYDVANAAEQGKNPDKDYGVDGNELPKSALPKDPDLLDTVKKALLALREKKRRSLPPSTIGTADSPYSGVK